MLRVAIESPETEDKFALSSYLEPRSLAQMSSRDMWPRLEEAPSHHLPSARVIVNAFVEGKPWVLTLLLTPDGFKLEVEMDI